jgi:hypothetical protein
MPVVLKIHNIVQCGGNDGGNSVMQKTLWCDSLYGQSIFTLEIHCQLMLVFGDAVLRPHHLGRGDGLASIMKITCLSQADQEHWNTAQVAELRLEKPSKHNSRFIHCNGVICETCT